MYFPILIGISVLTLCLGDTSSQAVSSIHFHRDDVPLSYKYNFIHTYATEKPRSHRPEEFRNIQYAPIVSNLNDEEKNAGVYRQKNLHTQAIASQWGKIQNVTDNGHLEPKGHTSTDSKGHIQYIAGFNIDTPKHDIGYNKINLEYKTNALNNNGKQSINKIIFKTHSEGFPPKTQDSSHYNHFLPLDTRKHQEHISKPIQVLSAMENAQIHPILNPYFKVPQLHLNVARAYNFAPMSVKAPLNEYQEFMKNNREAHIKQINIPVLPKTLLYPVNNKRQMF